MIDHHEPQVLCSTLSLSLSVCFAMTIRFDIFLIELFVFLSPSLFNDHSRIFTIIQLKHHLVLINSNDHSNGEIIVAIARNECQGGHKLS